MAAMIVSSYKLLMLSSMLSVNMHGSVAFVAKDTVAILALVAGLVNVFQLYVVGQD